MGLLGHWWRQSDHYDRLSGHLQARGMGTLTRTTITLIAAGLSVDALATIWTPTGPRGALAVVCALAAVAGAAVCALIWCLRWPTRGGSICFTIFADSSIALVSLAQSNPIVAMFTCTTTAAMAFYIALFHTPPLMIYNSAIASVVGAVAGVRIARAYGILGAVCGYSIVLLLNLAVPFGIQVVVHLLGNDAVRAERDQLTGLLTRRAFRRRGKVRLDLARERGDHLVIAVIDLDRFKQLNDSYGHGTGDDALVAVAQALRDTNDDGAVICRSGGEEFVIADIWHPDDVSRKAEQLCEVIAALPFGITASVGTAGIYPARRADASEFLIIEMVIAADAAMYQAKRRGGDQVAHHEWPQPPTLIAFDEDDADYCDGVSA